MNTENPYRFVIIEDNPIMQDGLAFTLQHFDDFMLVGQFTNVESAREKLSKIQPDLILLDITLTGMNGDRGCIQIKRDLFKKPKIIAYTNSSFNNKDLITLGFDGYVHKNESAETLVAAMRGVLKGALIFVETKSSITIKNSYAYNSHRAPREFEIMALAVLGKTNKEIASLLFISVETVKKSRINFKTKANLKDSSLFGIREYLEKEHGFVFQLNGYKKPEEPLTGPFPP